MNVTVLKSVYDLPATSLLLHTFTNGVRVTLAGQLDDARKDLHRTHAKRYKKGSLRLTDQKELSLTAKNDVAFVAKPMKGFGQQS